MPGIKSLPDNPTKWDFQGDYDLIVNKRTGEAWSILENGRLYKHNDPENIAFVQSGTGAQSRSVQAKLRDWVSITDFGAVGDGSTDDTTAINNALAAAFCVYIPTPSVKYKVTGALSATVARKIYGTGKGKAIIECTNSSVDILTFPDNADNIALSDFQVQHTTSGTGDGIVFTNDNNFVTVERIVVANCDIGFNSKNVSFLQKYTDCVAQDCATGYFAEGRTSGGSGAGTTIVYDHCYSNRNGTGFSVSGMNEVLFLQPVFDFTSAATSIRGITSSLSHRISIYDLHAEGTVGGDGSLIRTLDSVQRTHIIKGAHVALDATGRTFYFYETNIVTGTMYVEWSAVSGHAATNVQEYKLTSSASGTITIKKYNNTYETGISGTDISGVAGTTIVRNEDEGTWTPTIFGASTAGTQTYSIQNGSYTRMGRLVFFRMFIVMTALDGTTAGAVRVLLPFTSRSTSNTHSAANIGQWNLNIAAGYTQVDGVIAPNTNYVSIVRSGDNTAVANVDAAELLAATNFVISGFFEVAA